uniref:Secreted protein n=1 Tax=Ascaris lumbricoides TaxID=6252 RepID=A0A0M3HME6_ASCLU
MRSVNRSLINPLLIIAFITLRKCSPCVHISKSHDGNFTSISAKQTERSPQIYKKKSSEMTVVVSDASTCNGTSVESECA